MKVGSKEFMRIYSMSKIQLINELARILGEKFSDGGDKVYESRDKRIDGLLICRNETLIFLIQKFTELTLSTGDSNATKK